MMSASRHIRRTPGLDRSYTMSDCERLASPVPWRAGVKDPIAWFINCPGSEVCNPHFQWRDPEMSLFSKAMIFGMLRRIQEMQEELRLLSVRVSRRRWKRLGLSFLLCLFLIWYCILLARFLLSSTYTVFFTYIACAVLLLLRLKKDG